MKEEVKEEVNREEETIASEEVYQGRILRLRIDTVRAGKKTKRREIVVHPGAAAVVAMSDEGILLVEQYRKAVESKSLEIPAGTIEAGESPEGCAMRELIEETGFRASKLDKMVEFFPSPGVSSEVIHIFRAEGLKRVSTEPELQTRVIPAEELLSMIKSGKLKDGKTIIGVLLASTTIADPE